jgi:hypothetical protein
MSRQLDIVGKFSTEYLPAVRNGIMGWLSICSTVAGVRTRHHELAMDKNAGKDRNGIMGWLSIG